MKSHLSVQGKMITVVKVQLSNNISFLDSGLSHSAATAAVLVNHCSLAQSTLVRLAHRVGCSSMGTCAAVQSHGVQRPDAQPSDDLSVERIGSRSAAHDSRPTAITDCWHRVHAERNQ